MAIGNDEVKYKRSLGIRHSKERKSFKFSLQAASSQSLETNKSVAEGKSYVKKCDLLKKYNRREKNAEKDREPEKNDSLRSETRSADQTDNRASPGLFRGNEKSAFNEKEQDQEGCLACTITSETHAGVEVNVRQVPSFDLEDGQQLEQGRTKISNHEGAEKEYHDSFKARVAALRRETYMLSCELQKHATACMELSDANRLLMHELKEMCEPHVIQILEAKNPDNHPQTN